MGDVAHHRLDASIGELVGAQVDGDDGTVLTLDASLHRDGLTLEHPPVVGPEDVTILFEGDVSCRHLQQLVVRVTGEPTRALVDIQIVAIDVRNEDGVARAFHQHPVAHLTRAQRVHGKGLLEVQPGRNDVEEKEGRYPNGMRDIAEPDRPDHEPGEHPDTARDAAPEEVHLTPRKAAHP
jgi:hypothetical protein